MTASWKSLCERLWIVSSVLWAQESPLIIHSPLFQPWLCVSWIPSMLHSDVCDPCLHPAARPLYCIKKLYCLFAPLYIRGQMVDVVQKVLEVNWLDVCTILAENQYSGEVLQRRDSWTREPSFQASSLCVLVTEPWSVSCKELLAWVTGIV